MWHAVGNQTWFQVHWYVNVFDFLRDTFFNSSLPNHLSMDICPSARVVPRWRRGKVIETKFSLNSEVTYTWFKFTILLGGRCMLFCFHRPSPCFDGCVINELTNTNLSTIGRLRKKWRLYIGVTDVMRKKPVILHKNWIRLAWMLVFHIALKSYLWTMMYI